MEGHSKKKKINNIINSREAVGAVYFVFWRIICQLQIIHIAGDVVSLWKCPGRVFSDEHTHTHTHSLTHSLTHAHTRSVSLWLWCVRRGRGAGGRGEGWRRTKRKGGLLFSCGSWLPSPGRCSDLSLEPCWSGPTRARAAGGTCYLEVRQRSVPGTAPLSGIHSTFKKDF